VYTQTRLEGVRACARARAHVRALCHKSKCVTALGGAKQQKSCPRTQSRDTPLDQTRPAATRYMCPSPWLFAVSFLGGGGGGGVVFNRGTQGLGVGLGTSSGFAISAGSGRCSGGGSRVEVGCYGC
jgi:hypothetical protein